MLSFIPKTLTIDNVITISDNAANITARLVLGTLKYKNTTIDIKIKASNKAQKVSLKKLAPKKPWFIGGWFAIIATIFVLSYYTIIVGWVFAYFFKTLKAKYFGMTTQQTGALFDDFTSRSIDVFLCQIAA